MKVRFFTALLALSSLLLSTHAFGACVSRWSEIDQLGSSLSNLDINQIKASGSVTFRLSEGDKLFTLNKYKDRIYAKTPEGNAYVSLCTQGSNGLKATANLGLLGKKEALIETLSPGVFRIKTESNTYKASVVR